MRVSIAKQINYYEMEKDAKRKEHNLKDRWFYNYCVAYRKLCERVGGVA